MQLHNTLLFIGGLGGTEIVVIILVFVLFFGAKRIPELAKGLGRGIREFKDASKEIRNDIEKSVSAEKAPTTETEITPNR